MPFILPFLPAIIAGTGAAVGGALSSSKKSTTSSTNTSTTTPVEDTSYDPLKTSLMKFYQSKLDSPTGLPAGYESSGLASLNKTYNTGSNALSNALTARGLGTSPIAGAGEEKLLENKLSNTASFQNSLPLLARTLQNEDVNNAFNFFNARRTGSTTTGTGESTTTNSQNPVGAGLSSAAGMLGYLYGSGAFGGSSTTAGSSGVGGNSSSPIPSFIPTTNSGSGNTTGFDPSLINWLSMIKGA